MPLLYYWRGDNYRRDLDMGAGSGWDARWRWHSVVTTTDVIWTWAPGIT